MSTRSLPSRSTRGKRMNALVGDDALVDEEFWKMDMFKEDEEDDEYKSEAEEEDIIDADFDNPEEAESEEEVEVAKEKKEKKRMVYVDPKAKKGPKRRKLQETAKALDAELLKGPESDVEVILDEETEGKSEAAKEEPKKGRGGRRRKAQPKALEIQETEDGVDATPPNTPGSVPTTPKSTRKSTRAVAVQRNEQREKEREETEKKRSLRSKKRSPVVVRRITQEELLEEAKMTEIFNTESLKYILSMEEEKKKIKEAPTIIGPAIKYYSKDGKTMVCFDELPDVLSSAPPTPPSREICPITGLPAKYKDPKTGICYATLDAFKTLRTQQLQKEEAETNAKILQLSTLLQEYKRKKDYLQSLPKGVIV